MNIQNKITSIKINTKLINDPDVIANSFNSYFTSVAHKFIQKPMDNNFNQDPICNLSSKFLNLNTILHFNPTSTNKANKIIQSLKIKNSHEYDEITPRILKISAPSIISPLTYIFNNVLHSGIFPHRMKYSIIKPLHKKGTTDKFENYRPISLLTILSQILGKITYKRLYVCLEKHKVLSEDQYGFREKLSTYSSNNPLINSILKAFEEYKFVGGLFSDIHKAFDCVNHEILIAKLETYGISGSSKKLIQTYLKDRYERVVISNDSNINSNPSWTLVKNGVTQGSVLALCCFSFTSIILLLF